MKSYNKNLFRTSAFVFAIMVIASCGSNKKETTVKEETGAVEKSTAIELTAEQMKAVGIELGSIEQKNLNTVVKASGQLEVPPQNKAEITTLVGGVVRKIFVVEGNFVRQGQTLALIENTDVVKLQQEYLTLKSSFVYSQQEYQRQKELNTENAGTGKVFQQAQANYETDKARLKGLEAQLQQLGINPASVANGNIAKQISITAPISGVVGHIYINTGSYVEMSKMLMDIIDNSQIHCDLQVYEKDLFKVKDGQQVNFILTNQNNQQITGEIYGINQSFEGESKSVIVHAKIKNVKGLKLIPGMYVSALIDVGNQTVLAFGLYHCINRNRLICYRSC